MSIKISLNDWTEKILEKICSNFKNLKHCFCECYEETQTEETYLHMYIHEGRLEISNPNIIFNGFLHC